MRMIIVIIINIRATELNKVSWVINILTTYYEPAGSGKCPSAEPEPERRGGR